MIEENKEDAYFEAGEFSHSNPDQLYFKELYGGYYMYTSFSFWARDESRKSQWGPLASTASRMMAKKSWFGSAEPGTKTRHGQEHGHQRGFQPKFYATNTGKCSVSFCKKFPVISCQWRWTHQDHCFTQRSDIINAQMTKSHIGKHPLVKMKLEIFFPLQLKMLAFSKKEKE